MIGRRSLLVAGAAFLSAPALRLSAATAPEPLEAILAASGLGASTGFALFDLATGRLVEGHASDAPRPPASVAKIVTALYALDALGQDYRFRTRVLAAGPVEGGTVAGDLVLAGDGDPVLDTDGLRGLAAGLRNGGLAAVGGRLLVAGGALPAIAEVDPGQPAEAAYNPTIAGISVNFSRVFLAWEAGGKGLAFSAPGEAGAVAVPSFRAELVTDGPLRHRFEAGREVWSLPRDGLGRRGSVWLPVRAPAAYAGEVFRAVAGETGIALPEAAVVAEARGAVLALRDSPPLDRLLRDMLGYSTNLTAEVIGLRASQARGLAPEGLAASAAAMTGWMRARYRLAGGSLVNHSGLSDASQLTPAELGALLARAEGLAGFLKERPILDADRRPVEIGGVEVRAKTGTLDFVSALAGYVTGRRRLAFAILADDPGRRAAIPPEQRSDPPGAAGWAGRARAQEQALLRRWAALHAA